MDANLSTTIFQALSGVFEKMFFTVLKPAPDPPGPEEWSTGAYLEASISFGGTRQGTIVFYFPEQLARHITINFLGIEEEDIQTGQILDTVRETANMAGGSLLGELDPEGGCRLGIPEARPLGNWTPASLTENPGSVAFYTEYGLLWLLYEED